MKEIDDTGYRDTYNMYVLLGNEIQHCIVNENK